MLAFSAASSSRFAKNRSIFNLAPAHEKIFVLAEQACYKWKLSVHFQITANRAFQKLLSLPFLRKAVLMSKVATDRLSCRTRQYALLTKDLACGY